METRTYDQRKQEQAEQRLAGPILVVIGAVVTVGSVGVVWYVVRRQRSPSS
jgi:hypothetical protein